jgi:hypothetical protein
VRKKEHHPIYHLGKIYDAMMLFKPASIKDYKDSHQFSCKIQVIENYRPTVITTTTSGQRFSFG